MTDKQIRWEHIKQERNGRRLFDTYCWLNSCCEECNPKVRFWCRMKEIIISHQDKIISKLLNGR